MSAFEWDSTKEEAAMLIAVGELTNDEISERLDIGIATLYRWKTYQEFKDRVKELKDAIRKEIMDTSIGDIVQRIRRANKRWMAIDKLIAARGSSLECKNAPGGDTGLLTYDMKVIGTGPMQQTVEVFTFDAALLREERELQKYVSQELGQWTEKQNVELNGNIKDMSLEARQKEVEAILQAIQRKKSELSNENTQ